LRIALWSRSCDHDQGAEHHAAGEWNMQHPSGRVERQCVVKWADRDLEATAIISKKRPSTSRERMGAPPSPQGLFRDPKSLWINKMRVYVCGQGLLAYLSLSKHHGRVGGPHSDTVFVRWWTILILDRTRQPPERRFVMPARARQASDARIHTSRTPCRGITRVRKVVGTRPGVWQGGHSAIAIPASAERV
jgi:hypothetical protein